MRFCFLLSVNMISISRTQTRNAFGRSSPSRDQGRPGPQASRVFRRPITPPSQRSTVSRTPSPNLGKSERGGSSGSFRSGRYADSGKSGNDGSRGVVLRGPRDSGGGGGRRNSFRDTRDRNSIRDSRDLDGWSRGENRR